MFMVKPKKWAKHTFMDELWQLWSARVILHVVKQHVWEFVSLWIASVGSHPRFNKTCNFVDRLGLRGQTGFSLAAVWDLFWCADRRNTMESSNRLFDPHGNTDLMNFPQLTNDCDNEKGESVCLWLTHRPSSCCSGEDCFEWRSRRGWKTFYNKVTRARIASFFGWASLFLWHLVVKSKRAKRKYPRQIDLTPYSFLLFPQNEPLFGRRPKKNQSGSSTASDLTFLHHAGENVKVLDGGDKYSVDSILAWNDKVLSSGLAGTKVWNPLTWTCEMEVVHAKGPASVCGETIAFGKGSLHFYSLNDSTKE